MAFLYVFFFFQPSQILPGKLAASKSSARNDTQPFDPIITDARTSMHAKPDDEEYVAICMAVKDQSLDLPEWLIHHYHHLGVRRF